MGEEPVAAPGDEKWASLMRAALAGDETAYRRLLQEIGSSVRAMARGAFSRARVGDADVEDVVQETLLAIHLKRHTWDGGQKLAPWVSAIARHKIVDALRRRGVRRAEPIEDFEAVLAAPQGEDPHTRSDIERVLGKLAPRQRDIVTAISLNGQSIGATAARLSMSEVAVRVALHRALKALAVAWRSATQ
ncbi:MAG: sigma-70 family RNA polymerase sigma factor [Hyphomicrobiales bacterium]|nr:sigma-70 family RNA polymerase sigma factor [Hyphomicrobiales bacterium]MBV8662126.1 sigma-70 family RNA polymerase sigma factor [Hyphomicrobiales bacterium]